MTTGGRWRRAAWILAAAAGAGCRPAAPPEGAIETRLGDLRSGARAIVETRELDFGETSARDALWSGWGPDERNERDSFVWGAGESSRLLFDVVEPRDRKLRLRGWSFPFRDDPPQEVTVWLNGREAGRRLLARSAGTMQLPLAEDLFRVGANLLELRYARHHESGGEDPWAAGWDGLRLDGGEVGEPRRPRWSADGGELVLPARTAVEWTLDLPADVWLAWDDLAASTGAAARLTIRSESDERDVRLAAGAGGVALTREQVPRQLVGVLLRVEGEEGAATLTGGRLLQPPRAEAPARTATRPPPPPAGTRPNLIIYLIDTLRADHLGAYGYPRPTSPEIDRFAAGAVRWIEGRAQAPWTRPAVATILTGLYPVAHGAQRDRERVPETVELVSERLAAAGYETAFFTTNAHVVPKFGFDQGWSTYRYVTQRRGRARRPVDSAAINAQVFEWLARRDDSRPFLLVVHTLDPHDPYWAAEEFRRRLAPDADLELGCCAGQGALERLDAAASLERRRHMVALYDAEIAQNDASFGALLRELERRGLATSTALLLLADHGEEFYEHGRWKHGNTLYEEQLRIPFVLRLPGGAHGGTVLPGPVDQIDVVPTLLELAGVEAPAGLPGRSLLAEAAGAAAPIRPSFAWLERPGTSLAAVAREQWKLIRFRGAWYPPAGKKPFELYSLGSDPAESRDLALERALRRSWLLHQLEATVSRHASATPGETTEIDAELEATLRALGYL